MDRHWVDVLARAAAGSKTRRNLLRALTGAFSLAALSRRPSRAAAQSDDFYPGAPCQFDTQCADSGTVCDYVVETDDYRCCGYEGSPCGGGGDCCGGLVCPPGDFNGSFCASECTSVGCSCIAGAGGAISPCDTGLSCCAQGDPGAPGICLTIEACYYAMASYNPEGALCATAVPDACADGLFCCGEGDVGSCQTAANC